MKWNENFIIVTMDLIVAIICMIVSIINFKYRIDYVRGFVMGIDISIIVRGIVKLIVVSYNYKIEEEKYKKFKEWLNEE